MDAIELSSEALDKLFTMFPLDKKKEAVLYLLDLAPKRASAPVAQKRHSTDAEIGNGYQRQNKHLTKTGRMPWMLAEQVRQCGVEIAGKNMPDGVSLKNLCLAIKQVLNEELHYCRNWESKVKQILKRHAATNSGLRSEGRLWFYTAPNTTSDVFLVPENTQETV